MSNLRLIATKEFVVLHLFLRLLTGTKRSNYLANKLNLDYFIALQGLNRWLGYIQRWDKMHCVVSRDGFTYVCPYSDGDIIDEVKEMYNRPSYGETVIDAGAHYGFYSLPASRMVGEYGKVYAFEPCHKSFRYLALNIEANNVRNVRPICRALSDFDGIGRLYYCSHPGGNTLEGNYSLGHEEIQVSKLDTLVRTINFGAVDRMKVDVEGAELCVLQGAEETLKRYRPRLDIAAYHYPNEAIKVKTWLQKIGYNSSIVIFRKRQPYNIYVYAT